MSGNYYPADGKVTSPARRAVAVTPSDSTELPASFGDMPRAIYVGGAGNLAVVMADDTAAVTFVAVSAGTLLPIRARRVNATNTTATSIVALY